MLRKIGTAAGLLLIHLMFSTIILAIFGGMGWALLHWGGMSKWEVYPAFGAISLICILNAAMVIFLPFFSSNQKQNMPITTIERKRKLALVWGNLYSGSIWGSAAKTHGHITIWFTPSDWKTIRFNAIGDPINMHDSDWYDLGHGLIETTKD